MERSNFFALNLRDFFKGAIVAILAAVVAAINPLLTNNTLFSKESLIIIGMAALAGFLGYLTKNLFTNSNGEIAKTEPK